MSRTAHKLLAASGAVDDYEIDQSLRFNYSGQSYLARTPNAVGNRKTYTLSFWAKLCLDQNTYVFNAGTVAGAGIEAFMLSGGWQDIYYGQSYAPTYFRTSTVYSQGRDPTAWYHIFHVHDTTQSTAGNRSRTWINGVEFEEYTTELHNSFSYQDEDEQGLISTQTLHRIGGADDNSQYMDGNLAEFHYFDGAVKAVTDFGKTNALTGQWVPKKYGGGGYGTNGCYLKFSVGTDKFAPWFSSSVEGIYVSHTAAIDSLAAKSFTQEGWIYPENDGGGSLDCIWSCGVSQQIYWDYGNSRIVVYYHDGSSYIFDGVASTGNVKAGQWCHFAVVRNGNTMTVYTHGVGGTSASSSGTIAASTDNGYIGSYKGESAAQFKGSVYGFRSTIGTARYTSNFTPPTSDLTDDIAWDSSAETGVGFLQVTNSNSTITDAGEGHTVTKVGSWSSVPFSPTVDSLGTDHSGQENDWVPFNLLNDGVSKDTPTNNFATFNSVDAGTGNLTWGNLKWQTTSAHSDACGTFKFPDSGKWYYEIYFVDVNSGYAGIAPIKHTKVEGGAWDNDVLSIKLSTGEKYHYSGGSWGTDSYGTNIGDGEILQVAVDMDNNKVYFGDTGTWMNSGNPATGSNPAYTLTAAKKALGWKPLVYGPPSTNDVECIANFGQNGTFNGSVTAGGNTDGNGYGDFKYALPSGFKALCSKNLSDPTIALPGDHFNTLLYTGNDADDRTLTGVGFQPDLVIIAARNEGANWHNTFDAARGVSKRIFTNDDNVEITESDPNNSLVAFTSDGFTVDDSSGHSDINASAHTYCAWNWKAGGGAGSSNTDGTLNTTTTSVNTTAGISIGTYTGEGGVKTVGHGLGKLPEVIMVKCRSHEIDWCVYHRFGTEATHSLSLNDSSILDDNDNRWNDTDPTTDVFTIYSSNEVNDSGKTYVYYAFAEIEGFSKFGTYLGTGSTAGAFVHTGFRPAWIMLKNITGSTNNWYIFDNKRSPWNVVDDALWANEAWTDASSASYNVDFTSNGFKLRTDSQNNNSGVQYAYMAFAETPFKTANAR